MKEFIGRKTPLVLRKPIKNNSTENFTSYKLPTDSGEELTITFTNSWLGKSPMIEEVKVKNGSLDSESPMIDGALDFARKLDSIKPVEKWIQVIPAKIILDRFPTHIAITNNKVAANKYMKINSQSIYNGKLHTFSRANAVNNMHKYISKCISEASVGKINYPVQLVVRIYTVINHDCIKRYKDEIHWNAPKADYVPRWDEDNLRSIWEKCIKDCITKAGIWEDDIVTNCRGIDSLVEFVDNIEDRKIEISFKRL